MKRLISQETPDDETWATIEDAKQQIIDGEIDVPEFSYSAE